VSSKTRNCGLPEALQSGVERQGELNGLIEQLPESEVSAAARSLEFLIARLEPAVVPAILVGIDAWPSQSRGRSHIVTS